MLQNVQNGFNCMRVHIPFEILKKKKKEKKLITKKLTIFIVRVVLPKCSNLQEQTYRYRR